LRKDFPAGKERVDRRFRQVADETKHMTDADAYDCVFKAWFGFVLPHEWTMAYGATTAHSHVVSIVIEQYEFLFDLVQERVVAVGGLSWRNTAPRDSSYMSEFLGAVRSEKKIRELVIGMDPAAAIARTTALGQSWRERFFEKSGGRYDRGHFMSLRQGGPYDINLFPQRADVNQGHRGPGERYRAMERECANTPGTLCFSRPIYDDLTWIPVELEYGVIRGPDRMDIARFPNRPG
jgi:hypothetical protein